MALASIYIIMSVVAFVTAGVVISVSILLLFVNAWNPRKVTGIPKHSPETAGCCGWQQFKNTRDHCFPDRNSNRKRRHTGFGTIQLMVAACLAAIAVGVSLYLSEATVMEAGNSPCLKDTIPACAGLGLSTFCLGRILSTWLQTSQSPSTGIHQERHMLQTLMFVLIWAVVLAIAAGFNAIQVLAPVTLVYTAVWLVLAFVIVWRLLRTQFGLLRRMEIIVKDERNDDTELGETQYGDPPVDLLVEWCHVERSHDNEVEQTRATGHPRYEVVDAASRFSDDGEVMMIPQFRTSRILDAAYYTSPLKHGELPHSPQEVEGSTDVIPAFLPLGPRPEPLGKPPLLLLPPLLSRDPLISTRVLDSVMTDKTVSGAKNTPLVTNISLPAELSELTIRAHHAGGRSPSVCSQSSGMRSPVLRISKGQVSFVHKRRQMLSKMTGTNEVTVAETGAHSEKHTPHHSLDREFSRTVLHHGSSLQHSHSHHFPSRFEALQPPIRKLKRQLRVTFVVGLLMVLALACILGCILQAAVDEQIIETWICARVACLVIVLCTAVTVTPSCTRTSKAWERCQRSRRHRRAVSPEIVHV